VTGTNGKSSTTALTQHLLAAAGFDALRAGNIGQSLLELREHWRSEQVAVVEISSFQSARLAQTERLSGLLLSSLDVDHLDWHGDLESYHRTSCVSRRRCARTASSSPTPATRRW
jgi:UDP-N-acetylmuramoylalanine--D-glutamate ligase